MFNPNLKRSRDLDDVVVEETSGEHEFDSLPPTKKRVKIYKKTTTVIFDVDPCIVTRMNLVFPLTDIVTAFLVATSTSGPIRPTAEKRKRSNNDDDKAPRSSSALPIVTATQLIFPPSSLFLELSSSPSPFTESLSKKRKVDSHDDVSVDFDDDDVVEEEDRKPSASERWNLLNNNKSNANNEVICLDCDDDDDDGVVTVPLPTMKTAPTASSRVIVSSDDDDDEVQIVGSKGDNALADYPHARADCVVHNFDNTSRHGSESNKNCCKNCFCFVCDIPSSECQEWTSGSNHHCNAISGDVNSKWSKLRRQHKLKSKAKKATTTKKRRATAATVTPPRRKKQTTKTKLTTATKAKKRTTKAAREEQRTEIRLRLKAKFDAAQKNKKKAAAAPKKAPPAAPKKAPPPAAAAAVATIAAIPAPPPQCCSECSKGMQQRDVAVTDQFGHQFCFDCIITSVTNNSTGTGNNGNAPINLTGADGKKTCSSCGQDGHCLRTSKKCPVYWQLRKESAIKKADRLW